MSKLSEIQAAAETLPPEQKAELFRFLGARLQFPSPLSGKARIVRQGNDILLEAHPDAPAMTIENVKRMLEDWP